MTSLYNTRQYLTNFDVVRVPNLLTDVLVIGGGVAGLRAAIESAPHANTLLILKAGLRDSNTAYAQGGIAVAMADSDNPASHAADTIVVGAGLCDPSVVNLVVGQGPDRIRELLEWGAEFDRENGQIAFNREAGHSARRIVHAKGDATGAEVANTLIRKALATRNLRIFENCFAIDLLTCEGRCVGAVTFHPKHGHQLLWARQTVLATGGCGQLYRETTNPDIATGDGHAMAYRAGATLRDMEMVQFHPTTLYVAGASRALITEAVRGEGAYLVDKSGGRFMLDVHPDAELAPRDVVSRAIITHMVRTGATCVYIDARHIPAERFTSRFPGITRLCADFEIDVTRDLIPIRPSAHYMIGGVATGVDARTSVSGLLACGEAACTGLNGANRLASNSLLEGLVFGKIAAESALASLDDGRYSLPANISSQIVPSHRTELDLNDVRNSLRSIMWRNVGIERNGPRIEETIEIIEFWSRYVLDKVFDDRSGWETQNMLIVARLIAEAAAIRQESRGVHYRVDHPGSDDQNWKHHQTLQRPRQT